MATDPKASKPIVLGAGGHRSLVPQPCQLVIFGAPGDLAWLLHWPGSGADER